MTEAPEVPPTVADLLARAQVYVEGSHAKQTLEAYAADRKHFTTWCDEHTRRALPAAPETIICYLVEIADAYRVATLDRRLASISYYHKQARHILPTKDLEVERTMRGIRRAKGTAPHGKAPLLPTQLRQAIDALPDTLIGTRDHALLVIGFAGAFRRSELVALTMEDVQTTREGLIVTLRRSKTDQKGQTMVRGLPKGTSDATCPVRVFERWVTAAKITTGPIFRPVNRYGRFGTKALSGLAVPRIVKESLTRAGIDATDYSGHSLRAGLVTAAAMAGRERAHHHAADRPQEHRRPAPLYPRGFGLPRERSRCGWLIATSAQGPGPV